MSAATWKRVSRTGGNEPTQVTRDNRKTVARAVELFLLEKKTEGVKAGVLKKYERELARLNSFLEKQSKFFPSEITKELLTEYRATWDDVYPSSATRQQVQARVRRFLRFCHDAGYLRAHPAPFCYQGGRAADDAVIHEGICKAARQCA